jgi:tetratricopeptide (TPR) repeat protein
MLKHFVASVVVAVILAGPVPPAAADNVADCVQSADPAQSISGCTKAIACRGGKGRDVAWAHNNRGGAYANKGDFDRAIADYTRAIDLKPDYAVAYYNRGFSYRHKGDDDRAIADWSKALALKPDFADAYTNCGQAPGNNRALVDCEKAHQLDSALNC